jgi:signal transduction histidine kinase
VAVIIRRIASPLADLVSASDRIARRDYRVRVAEPGHGPGWVRDTARAFNAMAQELESQDDARRHLMADIAHELRTPLSVVQGRIEGLIDGVYPRDAVELQALLDDTRLVARLVEDLRTLSSAESGALGLVREPTDIVALATDVVSAFVPRASEAGVALAIHATVPPETRPISLDPVRIKEVLNNLIVNALRYTPAAGRVDVYVSASASAIAIRVVDTGPGIAPDDLLRIFDRFFKGAGSSGSGLGLTIARRLVEAHGGTLRAESEPGRGTTMIVDLPVTGETHG